MGGCEHLGAAQHCCRVDLSLQTTAIAAGAKLTVFIDDDVADLSSTEAISKKELPINHKACADILSHAHNRQIA